MNLQERFDAWVPNHWDRSTAECARSAWKACAAISADELDRLQARVAELGDLLCELIEHPEAGPFTDSIEQDLLHRWQDANNAAIDTARKAKP